MNTMLVSTVQEARRAYDRLQLIAGLRAWLEATQRRAANQVEFARRVDQVRAIAQTLQGLPAGWGAAYDRAKAEFQKSAHEAQALAKRQAAEVKRLEAGGEVRDVDALQPVTAASPVIAQTVLTAFGPAADIVAAGWNLDAVRARMAALAGQQGAGAASIAPPGTLPPPSSAEPAAKADSLVSTLSALPPWAPYAAMGFGLLLLLSGGKKR